MEYISFCQRFFAATGIPVNLLQAGKPVYSSLGEMLSFLPEASWPVYEPMRNPEFCSMTPDLEYGHVHVEGSDYDLYLGPVFTVLATEQIVETFLREQSVPPEYQERIRELLMAMPVCSHPQCIRYLSFLHLCLNHKEMEIEAFYAEAGEAQTGRAREQLQTAVESKEEASGHNSYNYELRLYHYIEMGDVSRLKAFLENTQSFPAEGRMAKTTLRHTKNLFISVCSRAVILGAIPGGLNVEKAYQLQDLYSVECEQLQTAEEVRRLMYIMLMDLCQRTGSAQMPRHLSSEIYRCVAYIKNHTNSVLSVDEIAAQIGRSRSYLMRRFKEEMGIQVNAYITKCKLEEACDLLTYGETSLAEISAYLGYSSQSYFQNVFKKAYGVTPMQYRKQNSKIK